MKKSDKTTKIPSHCVQCGKEMLAGTDWDKFVPICTSPKCPNFGLLQMGIEKVSEFMKKEEIDKEDS